MSQIAAWKVEACFPQLGTVFMGSDGEEVRSSIFPPDDTNFFQQIMKNGFTVSVDNSAYPDVVVVTIKPMDELGHGENSPWFSFFACRDSLIALQAALGVAIAALETTED